MVPSGHSSRTDRVVPELRLSALGEGANRLVGWKRNPHRGPIQRLEGQKGCTPEPG